MAIDLRETIINGINIQQINLWTCTLLIGLINLLPLDRLLFFHTKYWTTATPSWNDNF